MRIVFLGPPGSGKGTYAQRLSPKLGIPQVSTGDLFREHIKNKTEIGKKAKEYYDKGHLVPDEITITMLKERIGKKDCKRGFILDGYPRNLQQAQALEKLTKIDLVINLEVPENVIIARLSTRRICKKCGAVYNIKTLKPKKEGVCDICGGQLYQREDDIPEIIKKRIKVYLARTQPLLKFYKDKDIVKNIKCKKVDIPPETVVKKILNVIKK